MADKYANRREPEQSREEKAADIMQARLSWPEAERYAAALSKAGVLESGDEGLAVAILTEHVKRVRAIALIKDLVDYGAMVNTR
jgi:hypothetical protein